MRTLRPREVEAFVQGHTASQEDPLGTQAPESWGAKLDEEMGVFRAPLTVAHCPVPLGLGLQDCGDLVGSGEATQNAFCPGPGPWQGSPVARSFRAHSGGRPFRGLPQESLGLLWMYCTDRLLNPSEPQFPHLERSMASPWQGCTIFPPCHLF